MSDTTVQNASENGGNSTGATPAGGDAFKPITTPEELGAFLSDRVARAEKKALEKFADYDDLKAKAARLDEIEQANKTELQRVAEERDQFKTSSESASLQLARLEVAIAKGLTATQAKRLVGNSREELEADADELIADLGGKPRAPQPNAAQGREQTTAGTGDWLRDQISRR